MKMKITLIVKITLLIILIIVVIVGGILAYVRYRFWVCNKIPVENVEMRALCYCEMWNIRNKADQEAKDICYLHFAGSATDLSICEKIQSREAKDWCYSKIAYNKKEPSICDEEIQSSEVKDVCYYNLATVMIDFALCEKIQDERDKELCKEKVEQRLEK